MALQVPSSNAVTAFLYLPQRSAGHYPAARVSAARPYVDDIIGISDNVKVMLDDNDRVACVH